MRRAPVRDHGAVDVSVQMLFGFIAVLFALLLLFEVVAYWHARNVFDEAAAEGVRVAAAYDGDCADGIAAAEAMVRRHGGTWGSGTRVTCTDGAIVTVTVAGRTPGVLGNGLGLRTSVSESAPKEG
ncbi:MAG: hypothetical protein Q7V88_08105 [Actinomycetota bacterium]|nr:hypothetical protein [Actinomycetota bacterium]